MPMGKGEKMSDDITFCMDAKEVKCKRHKCPRHPDNITLRWREHSYAHFYGTEDCKRDCKSKEQPTADVVEVVRCKDCKHFHDGIYNGEYWMECDEYRIALSSDDWFCADGKRREDDTQN